MNHKLYQPQPGKKYLFCYKPFFKSFFSQNWQPKDAGFTQRSGDQGILNFQMLAEKLELENSKRSWKLIMGILPGNVSQRYGYKDVGDGYWRSNVLVTSLRSGDQFNTLRKSST